ncbi:MAG: rRNA pseudouridine synthase, partial [Proteobacteria bacterium]
PAHDRIMVAGKPLKKPLENIYVMLNKPRGVLTTMDDPLDRPTIAQYLAGVPGRVFPVGRLDWDSEGLLLLTNDGDFANRVTHPKAEVTKTYLVKVDGQPTSEDIGKLVRGVSIVGGKVAAKHVEKLKRNEGSDKYDWYKIVITEGKNRQIRQMFEKIGFDVMKLQRVAIGRLRIANVERGELVFLNDAAVERVFLPDAPDELKVKKTYKGRQASTKKPFDKTKAAGKSAPGSKSKGPRKATSRRKPARPGEVEEYVAPGAKRGPAKKSFGGRKKTAFKPKPYNKK